MSSKLFISFLDLDTHSRITKLSKFNSEGEERVRAGVTEWVGREIHPQDLGLQDPPLNRHLNGPLDFCRCHLLIPTTAHGSPTTKKATQRTSNIEHREQNNT